MRTLILSKTFNDQLIDYIASGEQRFGAQTAEQKKNKVLDTIENVLLHNPAIKARDQRLGLVVYPISGTPFFILYDYDDTELRVHFVFLKGKPLDDIDPKTAEW
jgi:plasmid stabilization system protein ParE